MDVYLFIYDVKPTPHSTEYGQLEGAHADIYVLGDSFELARTQAQSLLMDLGWLIFGSISERMVSDSEADRLWQGARNAYETTIQTGMSALFLGYGKKDFNASKQKLLNVPNLPSTLEH